MRPGFHNVTAYLFLRNSGAMFEFYKQAFGGTEISRHVGPDGATLMHGEIQIGDSQLMLAEENPKLGYLSPISQGGRGAVGFMLYVDDADAVYARAIAAGAKALSPMENKEYGRSGGIEDPSGYAWWITTHKG